MTKLIWKLYNQKKITLEVAVELLSQHDRSKEKKLWNQQYKFQEWHLYVL